MKEYTFSYTFDPIPPIMKRGRHVLIVLQDSEGNYILGAKKMYPENIYRLVGGGIDEDEDVVSGAVREVEEELQIQIPQDELKPLAKIMLTVTDSRETYIFETYLFSLFVGDRVLRASDDIDSLVNLTRDDMSELIYNFQKLPMDVVDISGDKKDLFRWSDYGTFYAEVHRIALELTQE